MHQKQIQIKRRMRADQINQIKATMRGNLIDSIQRKQREMQYCRSINQCIINDDTDALFYLFTATNSEIMLYLNDEIVIKCYHFLKNRMDNFKAVLVIESLIEIHFSKIFENYDLKEQNQQFVQRLYRYTNAIVQRIKNNYIDYSGALSQGLNSYLKILKNFYRRQISHNGNKNKYMLEINKTTYIEEYIMPWIRYLLSNKTFLFIIVKITAQRELLQFYSNSLLVFQTDLSLTHVLINNIYSDQNQCSIQSFKIIVNVINSSDLSQNFVQNITHDFLLIIIKNFRQFQKKLNGSTHSILFMGFRALNKLLFVAQRKYVTLNINCYIFKSQFYQILMSLLIIQNESNRQELYSILQKSLQILETNNLSMFKYINRKHFDKILEDISINYNVRTLSIVIRILLKIIRSQNITKDFCNELISYLIDKNTIEVLQTLQFHQNRQISLYAKELLQNEFREQDYEYTDEGSLWKIQSEFWKGNK